MAVNCAATGEVPIKTDAEVSPARTVAVFGRVRDVMVPVPGHRRMASPLGPAGPFRVTDPVTAVPPTTVVGVSIAELSKAGVTIRVPEAEDELAVPVIVAVVGLSTPTELTINVADVLPGATISDIGTETLLASPFVISTLRLTTSPPSGTGLSNTTVPTGAVPPVMVPGITDKDVMDTCFTVNVAVWADPL